MAWFDQLPLDYTEANTRAAHGLLKRAYRSAKPLRQTAVLAGIDDTLIDFDGAVAYLPMEVMDRAANAGLLPHLLAEVLVDPGVAAIHDELWALLGADAAHIHDLAIATRADFDRLAALPDTTTFAHNGAGGSLEKIVNLLAKFDDPALFRFELAKREARVARVDISNGTVWSEESSKGQGTAWLVGPDLVLTAYHVASKAVDRWGAVRVLFDYKMAPDLGKLVLFEGRSVALAAEPLLVHSGHGTDTTEFSEQGPEPHLLDFALLQLVEPVGSQGLGPNGAGSDVEQRGWFQLPIDAHDFQREQGLYVLGHPQLEGDSEAGPLKLTHALPSQAHVTDNGCRVRYSVNTEGGNSGSPIMDQDFQPLGLHHAGVDDRPSWDEDGNWNGGFNQGIPLHLITESIRAAANPETLKRLALA